jgi:cobalt-zinc-cadmium efflux system membrane fusion protein
MRVVTLTVGVVGTVSILCVGCSGTGQAQSPADPAKPASASTDGVTVDESMLASLTVAAIAERDTTSALALAGKVQFDEDRVARVLAPLAGQIVGLHAKIGDRVRAGDTLCGISSREAGAAAAEYIESRNDLDLAEKQTAVTRDLFEHEAASKIALQQAENDLGKAKARVARTSEALRVLGLVAEQDLKRFNGRMPITAPIGGVIVDRKVTEGQFVQPDPTPMVTVANLDSVWVMGDLFERDVRLVRKGQAAAITTAAYPGDTFRGRVDYISDTIDPSTRTAKVRVSVGNPGNRLKPEMFATVALQVADNAHAMTVPASAIFVENGRSYVYVEAAPSRFARRLVELASDAGAERRVLAGLKIGERVVTGGVLLLRQEEEQRASGQATD